MCFGASTKIKLAQARQITAPRQSLAELGIKLKQSAVGCFNFTCFCASTKIKPGLGQEFRDTVLNAGTKEYHPMSEWNPPVECPKCSSKDTRFVEPREEMSVYECNLCGCRFEIEE